MYRQGQFPPGLLSNTADLATGDVLMPQLTTVGSLASPSWTLGRLYVMPCDVWQSKTFKALTAIFSVAGVGGTSPAVLLGVYPDNGYGTRPLDGSSPVRSVSIVGTTMATAANVNTTITNWTPARGRFWNAVMLVSGTAMTTQPTMTGGLHPGNYPVKSGNNISTAVRNGALVADFGTSQAALPTLGAPQTWLYTGTNAPTFGYQVN